MKKSTTLILLLILPAMSAHAGITYGKNITKIDTLRGMYTSYQNEIDQIEALPSNEQAEKFTELKDNIQRARDKVRTMTMPEEPSVTAARNSLYQQTIRYIDNKLSRRR